MLHSWKKISLVALFGCAMFGGGIIARAAGGPQVHMNKALKRLQGAEKQLAEGIHNKDGHRVKALALTREAISETKAGIAAGEEKGQGA